MDNGLLNQLLQFRADKVPVAVLTPLAGGEAAIYRNIPEAFSGLDQTLADGVAAAFRDDRSGVLTNTEGQRYFVHVHNPPLRLITVGAVHIAQPLSRMAVLAGYDVTVIDPRGAFATQDRFPGIGLTEDWPDEAMTALQPDKRTAIVTLTHDPKLDDPALTVALNSDAFYIGCLGSTRTHAKRLQRLENHGFGTEALQRIHGPVGLDIGAKSPAEIAIAIMGQITDVLRRGTPLRAAA